MRPISFACLFSWISRPSNTDQRLCFKKRDSDDEVCGVLPCLNGKAGEVWSRIRGAEGDRTCVRGERRGIDRGICGGSERQEGQSRGAMEGDKGSEGPEGEDRHCSSGSVFPKG